MGETHLLCFWEQRLYILLGIRLSPCSQSRKTGRDVYSKRREQEAAAKTPGPADSTGLHMSPQRGQMGGRHLPEPLAKHLSSDILEGQGML